MDDILHITQTKDWEQAKIEGTYQSESLADEGFIHCSTLSQVVGSANRFFQGREDLVILSIDPDLVRSKIVYEGENKDNLFPHVYGELNIDAVTKVTPLKLGADGLFFLPIELAE